MKTYPKVTTSQYVRESAQWLQALRRGEHASIIFFPRADRFWRLQQFLEEKEQLHEALGKDAHYMFQVFDLGPHLVEDQRDVYEQISRQLNLSRPTGRSHTFEEWMNELKNNNCRLVIILQDAEKYLTPDGNHILSYFSWIHKHNPIITILSLYEVDITHPTYLDLLPKSPVLYDNIFHYPLYTRDETVYFIRYLQKKWSIKLNTKQEEGLVHQFGGIFWLTKEAVREITQKGEWSINEEGLIFRLDTIYNSMLPSERSVIEKIISKNMKFSEDELHSLAHLKKINFIDNNSEIIPNIFHEYVTNHRSREVDLQLRSNKIYLNGVLVDRVFSRKEERVLKILLESKGNVVSRDLLASRIWPVDTEKYYSDWAIDQIIARLRKRFVQLSLPASDIKAVRGKGYSIRV